MSRAFKHGRVVAALGTGLALIAWAGVSLRAHDQAAAAASAVDALATDAHEVTLADRSGLLEDVARTSSDRNAGQRRWLWNDDDRHRHVVFAFTVQGNGKRVVVFQPYAGGALYYALVAGDHAELLYPSPDDASPRFEYWPITPPVNTDALAFERPGASYTVLGRHAKGGPAVYVRTGGKLFKLLSQPGTVEGDLDELAAVVARGGGSIKHLEVLMDMD